MRMCDVAKMELGMYRVSWVAILPWPSLTGNSPEENVASKMMMDL